MPGSPTNIINNQNPAISNCCTLAKTQAVVTGGMVDPMPFSCIDAFYAFKSKVVKDKCCNAYASLLKTLFAIETKKV